ncbi:MAG TPA: TetR family transcriptional regulator [Terriglobales bacterium]|jgi:TetR/AcrR family transcriptional regulator
MPRVSRPKKLGSRGKPEQTRAAILQAAVEEFAQAGMSGARTDAIARAAKVNKALLYYYFHDKEGLYGAALDHVFSQLRGTLQLVLERDLLPRDKIRAYVGAHFDFIAGHPAYRSLVQREMMRAGHGSPHMPRIGKNYFQPLFLKLVELIRSGIASGDFRPVDPVHFIPSMIALVVFYFTSAPVMKEVAGFDPIAPERLAERRAAILDFVSAALFRPSKNEPQENASERA